MRVDAENLAMSAIIGLQAWCDPNGESCGSSGALVLWCGPPFDDRYGGREKRSYTKEKNREMMNMRIETERLIMRDFVESDCAGAFTYLSDVDTMYFIEEPYTMQQTEVFIKQYGMGERPSVYALVERKTDAVIGHVIFHPVDYEEIYEIGCIIHQRYQNHGYGYEILKTVIHYGFDVMRLHKIWAETVQGNDGCRRLLDKLHFTQEAELRKHNFDHGKWIDEYYYGLLPEDITYQIRKASEEDQRPTLEQNGLQIVQQFETEFSYIIDAEQ